MIHPRRLSAALTTVLLAFSLITTAAPAQASHTDSGYWMLSENGTVYAFGGAQHFGNAAPGSRSVDIEPTSTGHGYWILHENGTVEKHGDAPMDSTTTLSDTTDRFVSMSAAPDGYGYWLFTGKGRVVTVNADVISPSARKYGDMSGVALNGPILDSVATPSGFGYWMVASDGGVFSFGDAKFYGSMGSTKLNKPVMSMVPDPDGVGYWLVASDGGIFAFDAPFYGSMGSVPLNKPVSGMVGGSGGYLMVAEDGGIFAFGNVKFHGSLGNNPPASPVVAVGVIGQPAPAALLPPPPPPGYDWVDVDLNADPNYTVFGAYAEDQSIPFTIQGSQQQAFYVCWDNNGTYSFGCGFTIYRYSDGALQDGWVPEAFSINAGDGRTRNIYLDPGTYYVEGTVFGDNTFWGIGIADYRCTANC